MAKSLTILGASTRAAAFSARAAGFEPWCGDLFADVDLQAVAKVERVSNYPHGVADVLRSSPRSPWMYTGALENYPDLIDELAQSRPLYGNPGRVLQRAREPVFWSRALAEAGLPSPRVSMSADELPRDGSWLRKPLRSAHGHNITAWTLQVAAQRDEATAHDDYYYQERIAGVPIAAVFVATNGEAAILGVTRQILGDDWRTALGAIADDPGATSPTSGIEGPPGSDSPFRYAGSIGPVMVEDQQYRTLKRIGGVLARSCGLIGLFGVDAIANDENIWPVEINPRYTASIEVLERASALRTGARRPRRLLAIEWHERACVHGQLPAPLGQSTEAMAGKFIFNARRNGEFSADAARWAVERNLTQPRIAVADIPAAGTETRHGQPVLTLLADGPTAASVAAQLETAADELESLLARE
jgi:uncharacterized protein